MSTAPAATPAVRERVVGYARGRWFVPDAPELGSARELVVLPPLYAWLALEQPIVNGAALGMTVKTDGADAVAGAILDELMRARAAETLGVVWEEGWILTASILTKIWIDMFIGLWAFLLALVWVYRVERRPGAQRVEPIEI